MKIIGYSESKKYGVVVFDVVGDAVQDRQRCSNSIKEAIEIARRDMKEYPLSCASIYRLDKYHRVVWVKHLNCAGEIIKIDK